MDKIGADFLGWLKGVPQPVLQQYKTDNCLLPNPERKFIVDQPRVKWPGPNGPNRPIYQQDPYPGSPKTLWLRYCRAGDGQRQQKQ